jgi:PTH1 family peptidyl-tRNA hydrolase
MRLVVGLGNPGPEYDDTRHNVGFAIIDHLARRHRFDSFRTWKKAEVSRGTFDGNEVLLVKPMTFMNLSGESVGAIARFYKVAPQDVVVIHDELDFAPGKVRLKPGGGHGGHNGLRSIAQHIGADFCRIRVGIGKPGRASQGASYVLARLDATDRLLMEPAMDAAAAAAVSIVVDGLQAAMNQFNTSGAKTKGGKAP